MKNLVAILLVSTFSWASMAAPSYTFSQNPAHPAKEVEIDYDFGEVTVGDGANQTWEFTAPEDAAIYVSQITISGEDYWAETDCLGYLEAGYTCTFTLYFVPSKEGEAKGSVRILTNVDNLTLNAKGTGVPATAQ